jgi:hypothetical protein
MEQRDANSILDVIALVRAAKSGDTDGFTVMLKKMTCFEAKMRLKWAAGLLSLEMSEEDLDRLFTRMREDEVWA